MKIVGAVLMGAGILASFSARADLVDLGATTGDTASGLEWLDLSQTTGYSFSEVLDQLGVGGQFAGYRYGTAAEAQGLLTQIGFPIVPYTAYPNGVLSAALAKFDSLLGLNIAGLGPAYGFSAEIGDAIPGYAGYHAAYYGFPNGLNTDLPLSEIDGGFGDLLISTREVTVGYASGYKNHNLGHFLVKDVVAAVPEPQTLALMLGGLLFTAAIARKRRR
ncbi:MAG: PEP-CTERM sorting domain-containing protein [Burkholderiales bacterium]